MTYRISTDLEHNLITIDLSRRLNDDELIPLLADLRNIPDFGLLDQFVNFSNVEDYRITSQGVLAYADAARVNAIGFDVNPSRRIAIVAPSDLQFGMARIFAGHVNAIPADIDVFRSADAARAWLAMPR